MKRKIFKNAIQLVFISFVLFMTYNIYRETGAFTASVALIYLINLFFRLRVIKAGFEMAKRLEVALDGE